MSTPRRIWAGRNQRTACAHPAASAGVRMKISLPPLEDWDGLPARSPWLRIIVALATHYSWIAHAQNRSKTVLEPSDPNLNTLQSGCRSPRISGGDGKAPPYPRVLGGRNDRRNR